MLDILFLLSLSFTTPCAAACRVLVALPPPKNAGSSPYLSSAGSAPNPTHPRNVPLHAHNPGATHVGRSSRAARGPGEAPLLLARSSAAAHVPHAATRTRLGRDSDASRAGCSSCSCPRPRSGAHSLPCGRDSDATRTRLGRDSDATRTRHAAMLAESPVSGGRPAVRREIRGVAATQ